MIQARRVTRARIADRPLQILQDVADDFRSAELELAS
jgi:hypothetical protein